MLRKYIEHLLIYTVQTVLSEYRQTFLSEVLLYRLVTSGYKDYR